MKHLSGQHYIQPRPAASDNPYPSFDITHLGSSTTICSLMSCALREFHSHIHLQNLLPTSGAAACRMWTSAVDFL
jgi:hypothetical protein